MKKVGPYIIKQSEEVYYSPWIRVQHAEVIHPTGAEGIYGSVHFENIAVGVIPIDEDGNTCLVGQYRYPTQRYSWEIPEGGCPKTEDPLEAAQRELLEETGLKASHWEVLLENIQVSNSVTDELAILYVAKGLSIHMAQPEELEDLKVKKVPLEEAITMVFQGEITDSLSVMGLLAIAARK